MKGITVEEEKKLMDKEEFPSIELVKCPKCGHDSLKILWDSSTEAHKCQTYTINLVCNKCHLRSDLGGRNW